MGSQPRSLTVPLQLTYRPLSPERRQLREGGVHHVDAARVTLVRNRTVEEVDSSLPLLDAVLLKQCVIFSLFFSPFNSGRSSSGHSS